jgi:hypothetical protein
MTKYLPLEAFLSGQTELEVSMSFDDIEQVIGAPLPPAAFKHRAWWSNNPSNSVITHAWLNAGYKTERVDMDSRKLVFRRGARDAAEDGGHSTGSARPQPGGVIARLRRALGGTVRVADGVDLTEPLGEIWDAEIK